MVRLIPLVIWVMIIGSVGSTGSIYNIMKHFQIAWFYSDSYVYHSTNSCIFFHTFLKFFWLNEKCFHLNWIWFFLFLLFIEYIKTWNTCYKQYLLLILIYYLRFFVIFCCHITWKSLGMTGFFPCSLIISDKTRSRSC